MSVEIYCYRPDHTRPIGSHGPLDEIDDMYHMDGTPRTLDPTPEQKLAAGWCEGPSLAQANVGIVMRSLGYEWDGSDPYGKYDPHELLSRVTLARAVPPISDDGIEPTVSGGDGCCTMIDLGLCNPGYFARVYEDIAEVCEQAIVWGVEVVAA